MATTIVRLSPHFTLEEMIISQTAVRHGLNNRPSDAVKTSLEELAMGLLEPIRALAGYPISVSSGYRSREVNKRVGGSSTSQHMRGEAADINCFAIGQKTLFDLIRTSDLDFDQVIDEFGRWVHVSFTTKRPNRREVLRARTVNGKTRFTPVS